MLINPTINKAQVRGSKIGVSVTGDLSRISEVISKTSQVTRGGQRVVKNTIKSKNKKQRPKNRPLWDTRGDTR